MLVAMLVHLFLPILALDFPGAILGCCEVPEGQSPQGCGD